VSRNEVEQVQDDLREQVQFLRDGANREYVRMLNEDGSESLFAAEPRHFRDAYDSIIALIDGMTP
jgi:hypothetical protein